MVMLTEQIEVNILEFGGEIGSLSTTTPDDHKQLKAVWIISERNLLSLQGDQSELGLTKSHFLKFPSLCMSFRLSFSDDFVLFCGSNVGRQLDLIVFFFQK